MYRCIVCEGTWGQGDPEREGYSDGLCQQHMHILLVRLYRERQNLEKNPDCCGRSKGFCDRHDCRFRWVCLNPDRPPEEVINDTLAQLAAIKAAQAGKEEHHIH